MTAQDLLRVATVCLLQARLFRTVRPRVGLPPEKWSSLK